MKFSATLLVVRDARPLEEVKQFTLVANALLVLLGQASITSDSFSRSSKICSRAAGADHREGTGSASLMDGTLFSWRARGMS